MRRLACFSLLLSTAAFPSFASVDPGLLALVPPEAKLVSGIDIERARSSEFGQFMTAKMHNSNHDFEQFVNETGFDPRRDVEHLIFADTGQNTAGHSHTVIIARGNFDSERIESSATSHGFVRQSFQGADFFVDKSEHNQSENNGPSAFAFLDDGIAVIGPPEMVRGIIANRGAASVLDPALAAQVEKVGADNDAWFVSFISGERLASHFNPPSGDNTANSPAASLPHSQALQSVLQASGSMRFGSTVDLAFDALTRSPQDATSLADVVRFFTSMIQLSREKDPRASIAASAFDNMDLKTDGNAMHFAISLPEKMLEQLVDSPPTGVPFHAGAAHNHAQ